MLINLLLLYYECSGQLITSNHRQFGGPIIFFQQYKCIKTHNLAGYNKAYSLIVKAQFTIISSGRDLLIINHGPFC